MQHACVVTWKFACGSCVNFQHFTGACHVYQASRAFHSLWQQWLGWLLRCPLISRTTSCSQRCGPARKSQNTRGSAAVRWLAAITLSQKGWSRPVSMWMTSLVKVDLVLRGFGLFTFTLVFLVTKSSLTSSLYDRLLSLFWHLSEIVSPLH